jgi:hypothetical protein
MRKAARAAALGLAVIVVASLGVTVALAASGSGGGGSGGGGGGGGGSTTAAATTTTTATTAPAGPCALLPNYSASVGYGPGITKPAAVWLSLTAQSCAATGELVEIGVYETNLDTGAIWTWDGWRVYLDPTKTASITLDNDDADYDAPYEVKVVVRDAATQDVLSSRTSYVVTPSVKVSSPSP